MPGYWENDPKNPGGYIYIRTGFSTPEKYGEVADGTWQKDQERKKEYEENINNKK